MKCRSALTGPFFIAAALGVASLAHAQTPAAVAPATSVAPDGMADGEVRKVDKDNKKVTLRHGEIKSLGMPPMTMVFQVKDAGMLDGLKVGSKILFKAEQGSGALMVTEIQPAK